MADNTPIEWTATRLADGTVLPGYTFNPWEGCQKVGPGCDHCYAEARNVRFTGGENWGPHAPRRITSPANWRKPLAWNRQAVASGIRRNVFCASLADVMDNHATILRGWRLSLGQLILATPNLNWLLLTKRIGNAETMLRLMFPDGVPLNVWLGITVVNQAEADRDIPKLLAVKAQFGITVAFLSMEPLLGPVDLTVLDMDGFWMNSLRGEIEGPGQVLPRLNWIICGGESGPGARPMHADWARSLRDQCEAAGVAFFFKQWGEYEIASHDNGHFDSNMSTNKAVWVDYANGSTHKPSCANLKNPIGMVRVGKKAAGRLLDGREHNDMPGGA